MTRTPDDCAKRRLTERKELEFAIDFMLRRGVVLDDVPVQLTRHYYVDIDEVNDIMRARAAPRAADAPEDAAAAAPARIRRIA